MSTEKDEQGWTQFLNTPNSDALVLSEREQLVLDLYQQEEELRLQRCLLETQRSEPQADVSDISDDQLEEHLARAEKEALEARAEWLLRNKIVQHAIVTDPVLKAVHAGDSATVPERRLLPLLGERDVLMMVQNTLVSKKIAASMALAETEQANITASKKNKELAARVFELTKELKAPNHEDIMDAKHLEQLRALEEQMREERKRWRVLKNVVANVIVGSGIDWSESDKLRDLVMDDEEELG